MLSLRDARIKIENKKISPEVVKTLEREIERLNKNVRIATFSLLCIRFRLAANPQNEARIALKKMKGGE